MVWRSREARARFGELVRKAIDEGPQTITRHGRDAVVVLSVEYFRRLQERPPSLKEVIMSGPEGELDLPERELDLGREVEF